MHVMTDCAATLGSRFNLIFDPHARCAFHNAFGEFRERRLDLTVGVRLSDGEVLSLPFTSGAPSFPYLEQFSTLTTLCYRGVHPDLRIEFEMRLRAPFYPRNAKLSTAPVYYVDLAVRRIGGWRWTDADSPLKGGEIVFQIEGEGLELEGGEDLFRYRFESVSELKEGDPDSPETTAVGTFPVEASVRCPEGGDGVVESPGRLRMPFELAEDGETELHLLWTAWTAEPVLEVHGEQCGFKYQEFFSTEPKMAVWAENSREEVEERCDFLDGLFEDWSLGRATSHFSALALHSFLANTWWATPRGAEDWFSVWEGSCYFHSTVDVEYNDGLIYFALWPGLLDMLLNQWAEFEVDAENKYGSQWKDTSFLCHDMGSNHVVGRQIYPHDMEVEESANYLLMLAARTFFSGDLDMAKKHIEMCRRLADFIVACDTTGTGFPDQGAANTIDDASPALQFGREQTYLAVKAQAALWALAEVEDLVCKKDNTNAERWKAFAYKSIKNLNEKAWIKDHFAVTLTRTTEGLVDPWTGEALPEGELEGWDDYSIYTANGMLYLFLANIKMPRWKQARFARDIESAERATRTPYGSRHTGEADSTVWFSQNLWRDYVAAYLGIDMLNNIEAYWDYQMLTGDNPEASLYYDTTPENNLNFYPRGATVFGAALSAAGLKLNRLEGELQICPVRGTLRVPLLPLVNWQEMRAPWLSVRSREGVATAQISNRELLGELTVQVTGAELEKA
jgi:hypothetical protein